MEIPSDMSLLLGVSAAFLIVVCALTWRVNGLRSRLRDAEVKHRSLVGDVENFSHKLDDYALALEELSHHVSSRVDTQTDMIAAVRTTALETARSVGEMREDLILQREVTADLQREIGMQDDDVPADDDSDAEPQVFTADEIFSEGDDTPVQ